ncbi:MAG: nucleoside triphosphate pyrophosphohydrolase, partial [Bdellovibrionia bacterium]
MNSPLSPRLPVLAQLIETVYRLRAPGGCPWDRAQTHQSLRPYLIEEAYEVLDVLDQISDTEALKTPKIQQSFQEELGDLLMQVLLHSEMTREAQAFDIYDVAQGLNDKLIRRHPHVFGDTSVQTAEGALQSWEKQKAKEKASDLQASILDGLPKNLPALQKASRVIEKVTQVGFQWPDLQGPLSKVDEELGEFKTEVLALEEHLKSAASQAHESLETQRLRKKVESELGDLLFTLANVASLLRINPEAALRGTLDRFQRRFRFVEARLKEQQKTPEQSNLQEMDHYWDEAKKLEKVEVWGLTGGIASGKSQVAEVIKEAGIPVIDADALAAQILENNEPVRQAILQRFGTVEKAALKTLIFNDPQAKLDLERILHPRIQAESVRQLLELSPKHKRVVYEAALLLEAGRNLECAGVIVVEAPQTLRLERLEKRDHMKPDLAKKIMASQWSDEQRRKHAHFILQNTGTVAEL